MNDEDIKTLLGGITLIQFTKFDGSIVQERHPAYIAGWTLLDDPRLGTEFEKAILLPLEENPSLMEWIRSP